MPKITVSNWRFGTEMVVEPTGTKKWDEDSQSWFVNYDPGDYIGGCAGYAWWDEMTGTWLDGDI